MSQFKQNYADFAWVLAMVDEMIEESIYHTETFAHALKTHHNDKAAKVFYLACEQFKAEQAIVLRDAQNIDLPNIPPWEPPFPEYQQPSVLLLHANYLMSEAEAWKIINTMVEIHKSFYIFLLKENTTDKVINLTNQLT